MISKVFKYFIHLVMPNRVERIELLNEKIAVINRAIQETKRQININIDGDFNIDIFNNLGRRLANLKTELNSVIRERDECEYTYSPPRARKTAGDMRRFLKDGQEVKCRE